MTASLQRLCPHGCAYLLRVHPEGGKFGDPWDWCITVVRDGDRATLWGAKDGPDFPHARAMKEVLKAVGFRGWKWMDVDGKWHELKFK